MNLSNLFVILLINLIGLSSIRSQVDFTYHNHVQYSKILTDYAKLYPTKTHLYSIGKSVEGRDLWAIAIADSKPDVHIPLRPEAKYIGNMHGNEVASKEILIHLVDFLLTNQTTNSDADFILKNTRVHILPSLNPDGFERAKVGYCKGTIGRYNTNMFDLNRNFPELFECNDQKIQPETQAVIDWLKKNDFILSANFHGGSMVANYPYDNKKLSPTNFNKLSPTNDDDMFKKIAMAYSLNHLKMKGNKCGVRGQTWTNGITNGADWYAIPGGMQDLNYWGYGCSEITVELTCCKYPPANELPQIWLDNRKALLEYLKVANTGIKGIVKFSSGKPAENISVKFDSREPYFKTNKNGEYYRILLDGNYKMSLMLGCDLIYESDVTIKDGLLVKNITLSAKAEAISTKYNLIRQPVFCKQEVKSCKTYNNKETIPDIKRQYQTRAPQLCYLVSSLLY